MSAEDRIRNAYDDLDRRATDDVRAAAPGGRPAPDDERGWLTRPGLAIAGLVAVVAVGALAIVLAGGGGDDDQQVATATSADVDTDGTDGPATDGTDDDQTPGTDPTTDTDGSSAPTPGAVEAGARFRVATDRVAADTADPFLNLRSDPDAGADLEAKLPATYSGLLATGQTAAAADGGTWMEVELLHPVAVRSLDDQTARPSAGWVNMAFVEPLVDGIAVGADDVTPCGGGSGAEARTGSLGPGHLYGLESALLGDDCLRVVMTFASGSAPFEWRDLPTTTGPATELPGVLVTMSGGMGVTVDLVRIDSAWIDATETADGVYVARQGDGGLGLVVPTPANEAGITTLADRGIVVIDLRLSGAAPASGQGVVLTRDPMVGGGAVDLTGLGRPFEAAFDVDLVDRGGQPVEAVFSGNVFLGTRRTAQYGVATNDWTEAWGRWALRVEGLDPGSYTLRFDSGGADDAETFDVEVTLDQGGDQPTLATQAEQAVVAQLTGLARFGGDDADFLADEVILALGPEIERTATRTELTDPDNWWLGDEEGFEGLVGPFNPLVALQRTGLRITAEPVPHCASPPRDWPAEFAGLRQVNVEPIGIDSCIEWFGLHLFLDDDGRIAAVAHDLFGP